jgi:hypothetical protein
MKLLIYSKTLVAAGVLALLTSCGSSVTNVWDYYVTNEVVVHNQEDATVFKKKMLLRETESVNKSQLELIAFKQDSTVYLVIGSHKVSKAFYIHDSLYNFDVTDLYSSVRGNDFIRQMGDLSIFFTHIPLAKCNEFLSKLDKMKKQYASATVSQGATTQVDFYFAHQVFVSFEKSKDGQKPTQCNVWVGRRKHELNTDDFVSALNELKSFK